MAQKTYVKNPCKIHRLLKVTIHWAIKGKFTLTLYERRAVGWNSKRALGASIWNCFADLKSSLYYLQEITMKCTPFSSWTSNCTYVHVNFLLLSPEDPPQAVSRDRSSDALRRCSCTSYQLHPRQEQPISKLYDLMWERPNDHLEVNHGLKLRWNAAEAQLRPIFMITTNFCLIHPGGWDAILEMSKLVSRIFVNRLPFSSSEMENISTDELLRSMQLNSTICYRYGPLYGID